MVVATVTRAFATAHGIDRASSVTAGPEASPTPPPHATKRMKEATGPGAAEGRRVSVTTVSARAVVDPDEGEVMVVSFPGERCAPL
ncbi:hypothetical protein [Streptomyces humi]